MEAHFTYIYVFEADDIYKNPPQNVISPIFFAICSRPGAPPTTLLPDGALTYPQLPAAVSNVCTTDARLGGVGRVPPPPTQQKSCLLRWLSKPIIKLELSESCCSMYTKCMQCQYHKQIIDNLLSIYWIEWTDFVYFLKTVSYLPFQHTWLVILHILW